MSSYAPVLYFGLPGPRTKRIRRAIRRLGVEVEYRNVLLSRRHRAALRELTGEVRVPCLVVGATVMGDPEMIEKYLRLRYGDQQTRV